MTTEIDDFVVRYGEQYRALITDALEFLNVHEPGWRLETPVDREKYIKGIIQKLKGEAHDD